ncbi:hypothetical protein GFY24_13175 [Nocardia sp. SYP-A9097]|uniref:hypothetical protein n=1 Tax=Nocardia sp. SYP-A9097 TaxID=2663237 RepID=UPI00129B21C3|nr:hypothetical protein [Nocardia sp. SYP-A9097]MRH88385.1 hypothetical protein [Nocardia sp. SYP-A9097]
MARIFLSHSSHDSRVAVALKRWLVEQDHEDLLAVDGPYRRLWSAYVGDTVEAVESVR